jgi:uncharacterized SAM-dependent methyltransferase
MASLTDELNSTELQLLEQLAARYIWWKTPADAVLYPQRVAAQVMNIGDYDDVQRLTHTLTSDVLRAVLRSAEAGQFNDRSWHYWHYRLGLAKMPENVPPLPARIYE